MNKQLVRFIITDMDSLGQGVSRENGITFIEKVLPGESGTAVVYRKAKGVSFAAVREVSEASSLRIPSSCPEYLRCGGCQYLHTDYKTELHFKKKALGKLTEGIFGDPDDIVVHPAESRENYRNRVQLHYNIDKDEIGYVSKFSSSLVPAEECLLPSGAVRDKIRMLYRNGMWKTLVPPESPAEGTVEIYHRPGRGEAEIYWNKPYAGGEFSQVNNEMNEVLRSLVKEWHENEWAGKEPVVLDVFGGDGNLTGAMESARTAVVDYMPGKGRGRENTVFIGMDLYRKGAVRFLYNKLKRLSFPDPDVIVFDPPRKGIKDADLWMKLFKPDFILYISCNPATFRRDALSLVKRYTPDSLHLVDLFPGTRHFEIFSVFRKKSG